MAMITWPCAIRDGIGAQQQLNHYTAEITESMYIYDMYMLRHIEIYVHVCLHKYILGGLFFNERD